MNTNRKYRRSGIASIEYLMFMPILIAFAAATTFVIRIHHAQHRSSLEAETAAAEQAIVMMQKNRLSDMPVFVGKSHPDLAQLVRGFQPKLDIKAGLSIGEAEKEVGEVGPALHAPPTGPAYSASMFLTGAWEADVLAFPASSAQQRPLTFPASIRGIAPGIRNLSEFANLKILSVP